MRKWWGNIGLNNQPIFDPTHFWQPTRRIPISLRKHQTTKFNFILKILLIGKIPQWHSKTIHDWIKISAVILFNQIYLRKLWTCGRWHSHCSHRRRSFCQRWRNIGVHPHEIKAIMLLFHSKTYWRRLRNHQWTLISNAQNKDTHDQKMNGLWDQ